MDKKRKEEILKKLSDENLINKNDRKKLSIPFKEQLKKEIQQKNNKLNNLYLDKILLENKIISEI